MGVSDFKDRDNRIKTILFNAGYANIATLGENLTAVVDHLVDTRLPKIEERSGKIEEVPLLKVEFNKVGNVKSYCWTYKLVGGRRTSSESVMWRKTYGR